MVMYLRGELRYPFKIIYYGSCEWCGEWFKSQKQTGRFHSRRCKEKARRAHQRFLRLAAKKELPERICPHCGQILGPEMRSDAVYCSDECNSAVHNATRKASWKIGSRQERVSRAYIIERDGGRCHACGKKCRDDEIHLDHLVPLARGGTHAPENLAVACARCNLSRGARGEAQLLLLG